MSTQPKELVCSREKVVTCDAHGDYPAKLIFARDGFEHWSSCGSCHAERAQKEAKLLRDEEIRSAFQHAAIPTRYRTAKMNSLHGPGVAKLFEWFACAATGSSLGPLILQGPPGTGKTFASCAMLSTWIVSAARRSGKYMTSAGYCSDIRRTWSKGCELTEHQVFDRARYEQFLILDDLGAGKAADLEILNELIDARYRDESLTRTVIVTNIAAANFAQMFGERIADRLRDRSTIAAMTGRSKRIPLD